MKKLFLIIIIIVVVFIIAVVGVIFWLSQPQTLEDSRELTNEERACIDSGGTVSTALCCESTGDFSDDCAIGACGCAPEYSHSVKVCSCGENNCFDGVKCVNYEDHLKERGMLD
ncbi:MAG: hypothetical protein ABIG88_02565 [Patescibacteria group bacterium]